MKNNVLKDKANMEPFLICDACFSEIRPEWAAAISVWLWDILESMIFFLCDANHVKISHLNFFGYRTRINFTINLALEEANIHR